MEELESGHLDRPLVSIIVASYNAAGAIPGCLESIAAQSYEQKELIVIDAGSTDGTVQILADNDHLITSWVSEPDRGIYHAWNKGLERATGNWICFLGADDRFADETSLSRLTGQAALTDPDLVCGKAAWIDSSGEIIEIWGDPWNWDRMKRFQTVVHPGMLHRATLFERHGKFSEAYRCAGDYEFLLRLGSDTKAAFLNEVIVLVGKSGISHTRVRAAFWERKSIQQAHDEVGPVTPWLILFLGLLKAGFSRIRGLV